MYVVADSPVPGGVDVCDMHAGDGARDLLSVRR
jgi:hypothetical protein